LASNPGSCFPLTLALLFNRSPPSGGGATQKLDFDAANSFLVALPPLFPPFFRGHKNSWRGFHVNPQKAAAAPPFFPQMSGLPVVQNIRLFSPLEKHLFCARRPLSAPQPASPFFRRGGFLSPFFFFSSVTPSVPLPTG